MTAADQPLPAPPIKAGGRKPTLDADETTLKQLAGLGSIQATEKEVAAVLGVSTVTLTKFFRDNPEAREAYDDGKDQGKMSLRRRQWAMSEKNVAMQIWLGKQWLGQSERSRHELTGKNGAPIATVDLSKLSPEELDAYEALCIKLGDDTLPAGDAGGDPGGEGEAGGGEEPI